MTAIIGVEISVSQSIEYPVVAPATEYVEIPDGSSSAAPVMRPGPRIEKNLRILLTIGAACTPVAGPPNRKRRLRFRQEPRNLAAGDRAAKDAQVSVAQCASRCHQRGQGTSIERAANAHASHAGRTQLGQRHRF